ncbi:hypothetical protein PLEOSDRAFT_154829 [Pleurotus ostreatus PC15]|uniref:Uncharacterized protein n=1 Tax=Pleurotus ostreatus (strain PC15) TaxID=1137138 RepID=A0A067NQB4_PLEO1|nr:hypothetical protein PLEOSDRAFT_154829 [Pleurotus ostreatus PC15]
MSTPSVRKSHYRLSSPPIDRPSILTRNFRRSEPDDRTNSGGHKGKGKEAATESSIDNSVYKIILKLLSEYSTDSDTELGQLANTLSRLHDTHHDEFTSTASAILEGHTAFSVKPKHLAQIIAMELAEYNPPHSQTPTISSAPSISQYVPSASAQRLNEESASSNQASSSKHPSPGARKPISIRVKIEKPPSPGVKLPKTDETRPRAPPSTPASGPMNGQLRNEPFESTPLTLEEALASVSKVNSTSSHTFRNHTWNVVTRNHTTPQKLHRIRCITASCDNLPLIKSLASPAPLVPSVWATHPGDTFILRYEGPVTSAEGNIQRVWHHKKVWEDITKDWTEDLDAARIPHPDCHVKSSHMFDYYLSKNQGKPTWILSESQKRKLARQTQTKKERQAQWEAQKRADEKKTRGN